MGKHLGRRSPLHPVQPSPDMLYADLGELRTRGFGNRKKPLTDLGAILVVARAVSTERTDERRIEEVVKRAVNRLGGFSTPAVAALLGLLAETRGRELDDRRKLAAELYDYKTPQTFRAHHEQALLMAVGVQLLGILTDPPTRTYKRGLVRIGSAAYRARRERNEPAIVVGTRQTRYTFTGRRVYIEMVMIEGADLYTIDLVALAVILLSVMGVIAALVWLLTS